MTCAAKDRVLAESDSADYEEANGIILFEGRSCAIGTSKRINEVMDNTGVHEVVSSIQCGLMHAKGSYKYSDWISYKGYAYLAHLLDYSKFLSTINNVSVHRVKSKRVESFIKYESEGERAFFEDPIDNVLLLEDINGDAFVLCSGGPVEGRSKYVKDFEVKHDLDSLIQGAVNTFQDF
jgi:hypothetical protein